MLLLLLTVHLLDLLHLRCLVDVLIGDHKLKYPSNVVLLRGNHETREMTETFNFRKQCLQYWDDIEVYEAIMEMFDLLPVACLVNGRHICMHGGMSQELTSLKRIN